MVIETWVQQDLNQLVKVTQLQGCLFHNDSEANLLGVYVTRAGVPVTLEGECNGYVILPDGSLQTISGNIEDDKAWVVLPTICYATPGFLQVTLKIGTTTIGSFSGHVHRTITDVVANQ